MRPTKAKLKTQTRFYYWSN